MKKMWIVIAAVAALLVLSSAVSAQDTPQEGPDRQRGPLREIVTLIAEQLGIEPRDLVEQLRDGGTVSDVIAANGGDVETIRTLIVDDLTTRINDAVANGQITQERADQLLANLDTLVDRALTTDLSSVREERREERGMRFRVAREVVQRVAEQTGLTPQEIVQQLRDGETLAAILTANGVDVTAFIDAVIAEAQARLDEAVSAGTITQERADALLEQLRTTLPDRLNEPMLPREETPEAAPGA